MFVHAGRESDVLDSFPDASVPGVPELPEVGPAELVLADGSLPDPDELGAGERTVDGEGVVAVGDADGNAMKLDVGSDESQRELNVQRRGD